MHVSWETFRDERVFNFLKCWCHRTSSLWNRWKMNICRKVVKTRSSDLLVMEERTLTSECPVSQHALYGTLSLFRTSFGVAMPFFASSYIVDTWKKRKRREKKVEKAGIDPAVAAPSQPDRLDGSRSDHSDSSTLESLIHPCKPHSVVQRTRRIYRSPISSSQ